MIEMMHADDPRGKPHGQRWPYVYAHGQAEQYCMEHFKDGNAPDIIISDTPMPTEPGEYPVTFYGQPAIAVLSKQHGHMEGRMALESDTVALAHCRTPDKWM